MTKMSDALAKANLCNCLYGIQPHELTFLNEAVRDAMRLASNKLGKRSTLEKLAVAFLDILQRDDCRPAIIEFCRAWRDDQNTSVPQRTAVVQPTTSRAETEGQLIRETLTAPAPPARGELSVPSADGDGTGEDQAASANHASRVSPAPSKSLPSPIREPSPQRLSAMLTTRLDSARSIMDTSLPTGPGNHRISLGDLPASKGRLDRMIHGLGKRTGEGAITYNILIQYREHIERIAYIPPGATFKELLNEKDAVDLVKSAKLTTINTLFQLPRELPTSEDFAKAASA